jgi:hypothetical protein
MVGRQRGNGYVVVWLEVLGLRYAIYITNVPRRWPCVRENLRHELLTRKSRQVEQLFNHLEADALRETLSKDAAQRERENQNG